MKKILLIVTLVLSHSVLSCSKSYWKKAQFQDDLTESKYRRVGKSIAQLVDNNAYGIKEKDLNFVKRRFISLLKDKEEARLQIRKTINMWSHLRSNCTGKNRRNAKKAHIRLKNYRSRVTRVINENTKKVETLIKRAEKKRIEKLNNQEGSNSKSNSSSVWEEIQW
jgi:hypothetical protein